MKLVKKLAALFAATTALAFSSCSNLGLDEKSFQNKVNNYFLEMTSTAAVSLFEISPDDTVKNKAGVDCVPASGDHVVTFYLRNPQKYRFEGGNIDFRLVDFPETWGATIAQDPNDSAKINITYSNDFLLEYPLGADISPIVELFHPVSHKSFGVFDKMKISSNTPPPSVQLACFQSDKDGGDVTGHYVVCFYLPKISEFANSYKDGKTDVHTFYVNGTKKYLNISDNMIYNSATVDDTGTWFFSDPDPNIKDTLAVYPLSDTGFAFNGNDPEYTGSYVARYLKLADKTINEYGVDTVTCNFTIEDDAGLSASLATSNKATRLSVPILQDTDGNAIASSAVVTADEESGFYTLRIVHNGMDEGDGTNPPKPCGQVNINYTITKTAGSVPFGDEHGVLRGSSAGSATIKLPGRCTFDIQATASKNYYITSLKTEATTVRVTQPAVFFVSQTGDDTNGTGAKATPFRTVQKAIDVFKDPSSDYTLSEGCKIYVMSDITVPDSYHWTMEGGKPSFVVINFNAPVTIQGYGGTWTLDASAPPDLPRSCITISDGKLTLQNINITGAQGEARNGHGSAGISIITSGDVLKYTNGRVYGIKKAPAVEVACADAKPTFTIIKFDNNGNSSADDGYDSGCALNVGGNRSEVVLNNCDFIDNGALGTATLGSSSGGAICVSGNDATKLTINGGSIKGTKIPIGSNDKAKGGAICVYSGNLVLKDVEISGSLGALEGGAIYVESGSTSLTNVKITGNNANKYGAIYTKGMLTLDSCTITGNHADSECAGVWTEGTLIGLQISGKNTIYDNCITGTTTQSNLYMPYGKYIDIDSSGDNSVYNSLIGVYVDLTGHEPTVGNPRQFTRYYGYVEGQNIPPKPGIVFRSENGYGIAATNTGDASFAVSSASSYNATDYTFTPTLRTDCAPSVYPGATKTFVINDLIGKRKVPGTSTPVVYNSMYLDPSALTLYTKLGTPETNVYDPTGKTVSISAALYSGGTKVRDATVDSSDARRITLVAKTAGNAKDLPPNNYTLKIIVEFLGATHEANIPIAVDYSAETVADYINKGLTTSGNYLVKVTGTVGPGMDEDPNASTGDEGLAKVAKAIYWKQGSGVTIDLDATGTSCVYDTAAENPLHNYNHPYFKNCTALHSFKMPDWMLGVLPGLFSNCSGLASVEIPGSIVSIGEDAFYYCGALSSITFGGTSAEWKDISFGQNWRCGVTSTNKVYCAGDNTDVYFGFFEVTYIRGGSAAEDSSCTSLVSGSGTSADPYVVEGDMTKIFYDVDTDDGMFVDSSSAPSGVTATVNEYGTHRLAIDRSAMGDLPDSGYWSKTIQHSGSHNVYFKIMPEVVAVVPEGFVDFKIPAEGKSFTIGYSGYDNTTPHTVTLKRNFWMCDHEVTQAEYQEIMGTNPSYFDGSDGKEAAAGETQSERPVEQISWYAAITYCNKRSIAENLDPCYTVSGVDFTGTVTVPTTSTDAWNNASCDFTKNGYRLPTEAEWEFAARGIGFEHQQEDTSNKVWAGTNTEDDLEKYAWYSPNAGLKTHAVKTNKTAGVDSRNAAGLYDMSGNVAEWCWDFRDDSYYSTESQTDPTGGSPDSDYYRVRRGGSYVNYETEGLAIAYRGQGAPHEYIANSTGIRVVRTAPNP